jgi:hypothetical protein
VRSVPSSPVGERHSRAYGEAMTSSVRFGDPDWILLGAPIEGGDVGQRVQVFASDELTEAELKVEVHHPDPVWIGDWYTQNRASLTEVRISATGKSYATAWGDTYEEAIANLMKFWAPKEPGRPAAVPAVLVVKMRPHTRLLRHAR